MWLLALVLVYAGLCGVAALIAYMRPGSAIVVPSNWSSCTAACVVAIEFGTMIGWVWVLSSESLPNWVQTVAIVAQSLMLAWVLLSIVPGTTPRTLVGITVLAMPLYVVVALAANSLSATELALVWLHTAHRVLLDGWWAVSVHNDGARSMVKEAFIAE